MADFIAVYGSLRRGQRAEVLTQKMEFVGEGRINASLFALGWYPGAKFGTGRETAVDVFRLPKSPPLREAILHGLHQYEGYSPMHPDESLFVPKEVQVNFPSGEGLKALCYEYNPPVNRAPLVENGDWNEYVRVPCATN